MRSSIFVAIACLAIGAFGALGYSHYLGEGKQLAALQVELSDSKATLEKVKQDSADAKKESDAMSAQIQQLTSTKDDLKHQLEALKGAVPTDQAQSAGGGFPFFGKGMQDMVKAQFSQRDVQRLQLLKSRLHLTPEQEAAVKAAMDEEQKRTEEMTSKMMAGGKINPQEMVADMQKTKSVEQTLDEVLTPDQKKDYSALKTEETSNNAQTVASSETNQFATTLGLSDSQKDQVYNALYQDQMNQTDSNWVKNNLANATNAKDPASIMDAQAKAKEDSLAKILTPDQLSIYHQQAQAQLNLQKEMVKKFSPGGDTIINIAPANSP